MMQALKPPKFLPGDLAGGLSAMVLSLPLARSEEHNV